MKKIGGCGADPNLKRAIEKKLGVSDANSTVFPVSRIGTG